MMPWHARRFKAVRGRGLLICSLDVEERGSAIFGTGDGTSETTANVDSRLSLALTSSADIRSAEIAISRLDGISCCGGD